MNLLVTALVSLIVGITEKVLPTFIALWRERQANIAAEAKLAAEVKKIDDAINKSEPTK